MEGKATGRFGGEGVAGLVTEILGTVKLATSSVGGLSVNLFTVPFTDGLGAEIVETGSGEPTGRSDISIVE